MSSIEIVCTDKDRHRKLTIVRLQTVSNGQWCESTADREGFPGEFRVVPVVGLAQDGIYPLRCRRCGRDTRMNIATLTKVLDTVADTGGVYLDLSRLPF